MATRRTRHSWNLSRTIARAGCAGLILGLGACSDDPKAPYVEVQGGGFIFNYQVQEVFYGLVVKPVRKLPIGTQIVASFEDPAGGPPIEVKEQVDRARLQYTLRTPGLTGVVKDKPYAVTVSVIPPPGSNGSAQELHRTFKSDLDQSILPEKRLVLDPWYTPNQEALKDMKDRREGAPTAKQ